MCGTVSMLTKTSATGTISSGRPDAYGADHEDGQRSDRHGASRCDETSEFCRCQGDRPGAPPEHTRKYVEVVHRVPQPEVDGESDQRVGEHEQRRQRGNGGGLADDDRSTTDPRGDEDTHGDVLPDQEHAPRSGVAGKPGPRGRVHPAEAFDDRRDGREVGDQRNPDEEQSP